MSFTHTYPFMSERLGFRNWIESDIKKMAAINLDANVMEFFRLYNRKNKLQYLLASDESIKEMCVI